MLNRIFVLALFSGLLSACSPKVSTEQFLVEQLISPCVRITHGDDGGSGTVISSSPDRGTWVLTAAHVVSACVDDGVTVDLFTYDEAGHVVDRISIHACIEAISEDEDLAILIMEYVPGASAAPIYQGSLHLFQEVYAVGCPMLLDPMSTKGHIIALDVHGGPIDKPFAGSSSDIYPGNSGGALMVEDGGVWYIAGVMSWWKRVTYLGYYSPPERVRAFLEAHS